MTVLVENNTASYSTSQPATLNIMPVGKIRTVYMNGEKITNWKKDEETGLISLKIPAAEGKIELKPASN
ncbi:MAG: hypothetical protein HOC71_12645 [Candidatus Latescibacteria bacterium]|nr:hypothetical protein [Candidatus Latescibacterota bacterium]